jgi:hypothetical protein
MSLKLHVHSLSDSLKSEKRKSRAAVEQLLIVMSMQHNKMLETLEVKINNIQTKHDLSLRQLQQDKTNNQQRGQRPMMPLLHKILHDRGKKSLLRRKVWNKLGKSSVKDYITTRCISQIRVGKMTKEL